MKNNEDNEKVIETGQYRLINFFVTDKGRILVNFPPSTYPIEWQGDAVSTLAAAKTMIDEYWANKLN